MGIAEVVGLALLLVALLIAVLAYLRVRAVREAGIDVALRAHPGTAGRGWHLGVARYRGDELVWFRASSLRSGPDRVLDRGALEIVRRRDPTLPESYAVPSGSVVLACRDSVGELELAMTRDTLTGFLSWLESAPPAGKRAR